MKLRKRFFRRVLFISGGFAVASVAFFALANARVLGSADGKLHSTLSTVPHHRVAIVLGTAPRLAGGYPNPYFVGRMNAAFELYRSGKVERILVSGDNGKTYYDEPTAMAEALVAKGIPAEHITKDFAGFRTLDTMVRARKVFGVTDATIVTDDFHMARSLYHASCAGIRADGFPSHARPNSMTAKVKFREVLARGLAVLDSEIMRSQPKFLGKKEVIL